MKPIRIFVINNVTASMFMAAYYQQENLKNSDFRNICIVLLREGFSEDDLFIDTLKKIARFISSEVLICAEPKMQFTSMAMRNIADDRKRKKTYLKMVRKMFVENNIDHSQIKEVCHANRNLHQYIKYLNPKVVLVNFEHGLAEVRDHLLTPFINQRIKNFLKTVLGRLFFVFVDSVPNDDLRISVFASRIKRIHPRLPIKLLKHEYVRKVSRMIIGEDIKGSYSVEQNGSVAVILLQHINVLTDRKEDHLKVHRDFIKYILGEVERIVPKIDTVIFKIKKFEIYFCDVKAYTMEIFKDYRVIFFDEICNANYPIEFCLDFLQPKVIFGNSSSGLYYSKELMPEIKTYTFHPYFLDSLTRHIGKIFYDFDWFPKLFDQTYRSVFEDILPIKIPLNTDKMNFKSSESAPQCQ